MIRSIRHCDVEERRIGHIGGIAPGAEFHRRVQVQHSNLHGDIVRGISSLEDEDGSSVADAIVLHGGYQDDEDDWTRVHLGREYPVEAQEAREAQDPLGLHSLAPRVVAG